MNIPIYRKPSGYSLLAKAGTSVIIAAYGWTLARNMSEILSMPILEVLWMYGLPTVMGIILIAMMLFDISFRKPDRSGQ